MGRERKREKGGSVANHNQPPIRSSAAATIPLPVRMARPMSGISKNNRSKNGRCASVVMLNVVLLLRRCSYSMYVLGMPYRSSLPIVRYLANGYYNKTTVRLFFAL